jgi:hypothetical protein
MFFLLHFIVFLLHSIVFSLYVRCLVQGRDVRVLNRIGGVYWSDRLNKAEMRAGFLSGYARESYAMNP